MAKCRKDRGGAMPRFGVMKHLKLLQQAGLVATRRQGREKLHYLNAGPIRLIHDRWVNKFTAPPIFEGENLEVDPPRRLVQSFRALRSEDVKGEGTSRVTWEIEPVGDSCLLKVTHDQLRDGANSQLFGGWPMILSGMKTLLETGGLLTTPGSLRWQSGESAQPSGACAS